MKHIHTFESFLNEAVSTATLKKTTIQDFIGELGTWPEWQSKVEDPGDAALVKAFDDGGFYQLLVRWSSGKYDEDMQAVVNDLNQIITKLKKSIEAKAKEEADTNYVKFWQMDRYNDGNSSVTFKSDKRTLEKIQKEYLPQLEAALQKEFSLSKYAKDVHSDKQLIGDNYLDKWDKGSKHYSLVFYPLGWMIDGDMNKFVQFIKNWTIDLAKKLRFTVK